MSKNIPNKQGKSYTFYTVLATVFSFPTLISIIRFLSPKFALDSEGQVNKWTYLIWFQIVVIACQLFGLWIRYT